MATPAERAMLRARMKNKNETPKKKAAKVVEEETVKTTRTMTPAEKAMMKAREMRAKAAGKKQQQEVTPPASPSPARSRNDSPARSMKNSPARSRSKSPQKKIVEERPVVSESSSDDEEREEEIEILEQPKVTRRRNRTPATSRKSTSQRSRTRSPGARRKVNKNLAESLAHEAESSSEETEPVMIEKTVETSQEEVAAEKAPVETITTEKEEPATQVATVSSFAKISRVLRFILVVLVLFLVISAYYEDITGLLSNQGASTSTHTALPGTHEKQHPVAFLDKDADVQNNLNALMVYMDENIGNSRLMRLGLAIFGGAIVGVMTDLFA